MARTFPTLASASTRRGQENLFPNFTTWRQQIDGKYWFPVYTKVDDELHFSSGDVHVRQVVKYSNYKRFGSNVEDHLRRPGNLEGPAAAGDTAAGGAQKAPPKQ